jgi:REP element-mobilizing transposase RayT
MSRPLRFVPAQKTLIEVSTRTVQSRFLLRPSNALNEIVLGILGRAQEIYGVGLCGYVCLSSHYHLLLLVDTAKQLADFMGYFNSNLAREAGRLVDWREKFWSRRYRAIVVSGEEGAQRERLKYVLSHGAKEGLVGDPREWPGVHAIRPLLDGDPAQGIWFDRTQEYAARRRGEEFERLRYTTPYSVTLSPLPCWEDLPAELQRQRIAEIAEEIAAEAAARQEEKGEFSFRQALPPMQAH